MENNNVDIGAITVVAGVIVGVNPVLEDILKIGTPFDHQAKKLLVDAGFEEFHMGLPSVPGLDVDFHIYTKEVGTSYTRTKRPKNLPKL